MMKKALTLLVGAVGALGASLPKLPELNVTVFNPQSASTFSVTSTILESEDELVIVDAQFEKSNAQKVVDIVKSKNKTPSLIFISHSDPDYYFGLDTIHKAFPDTRILATSTIVDAIKSNYEAKEKTWYPQMGDEKPDSIIIPEATNVTLGQAFSVGKHPIFVAGLLPERAALYAPTIGTVFNGILVEANEHVWLADTKSRDSRENWLSELESLVQLRPSQVIPGHYTDFNDSSAPRTIKDTIQFTRNYIDYVNRYNAKTNSSAELIEAVEKQYPDLAGVANLEMSAKVLKDEIQWP